MRIQQAHLPAFPLFTTKFTAGTLAGKTVIVKVDMNATVTDGIVQNPEKVMAPFATIESLINMGANVVLASHFGRPKDQYDQNHSLSPVYTHLLQSRLAKYGIGFAGHHIVPRQDQTNRGLLSTYEYLNPAVEIAVSNLGPSQRIFLLENVRLAKAEKTDPNSAEYQELTKKILSLSDGIVIFDAAAVWDKEHASITGILRQAGIDNIAWGFHARQQIEELIRLMTDPTRPFVFHISGTKPEKLKAILGLLDNPRVDQILVSGNIANALIEAEGIGVGKATGEYAKHQETINQIVRHPRYDDVVSFPEDVVMAEPDRLDLAEEMHLGNFYIPDGYRAFDIGPETAKKYAQILAGAGLAINAGPAGAFDLPEHPFVDGTRTVMQGLAQAGQPIILGGEGGVAANQLLTAEETAKIDIRVVGGAFLRSMAGTFPVAEAFLEMAGIST